MYLCCCIQDKKRLSHRRLRASRRGRPGQPLPLLTLRRQQEERPARSPPPAGAEAPEGESPVKRTQKRRKIIVEKTGYLRQTTVVTRSSISKGRNLPRLGHWGRSRKNSLNSFFSLYKNPIDLNLNPISSESDEIGIQTQMFKMASRARITILRDESSRIVARFAKCIVCLCV